MSTTRLAAILFTDIVGYTAMMQQNRAEAMHAVRLYEAHLKDKIAQHEGELLQTYGDGSLSIFNSASAAVQCAKELQEAIHGEVPLRIGIHMGEVTIDVEHIFGDGVNIASRVESMGVAGSVLVSSSIRQQIKNRPEFELISLGRFTFKNVAEPMTVYALGNAGLNIPKPEEIQGKAASVKPNPPLTRWIPLATLGLVSLILATLIFWVFEATSQKGQLSDKIKEERVATIPFKNLSTDSSLAVFGDFCSNLITHGLTEAGIKTSSPQTVQQYHHLIGSLPNNPDGKASFSEVIGARYWIEGNFSKTGDTLSVKSHLTDGFNGDIVRNFPEVKGHIDNKEKLANDLTRRLMSYWVARDLIDREKFKAPRFEAFQEYQKIFTTNESGWWDRSHALKAFALDTTFYLAALEEMFWLAETEDPKYDSMFHVLAAQYDKMTTYEQLRFNANKALHDRDKANYTKYNEALYQRFPQDFSQPSHYSWHLCTRENRPLKAWEVRTSVDWHNVSEEFYPFRWQTMWFITLYGLGAGKYQETIEYLDAYRPLEAANFQAKSFIYARTNQLDSIYSLAAKLSTMEKMAWGMGFAPEYNYVNFCNDAGETLLIQEKPEAAKKILQMAIDWTEEKPERLSTLSDSLDLARTWRLMGYHERALPLEIPFISKFIQLDFKGRSACRYFSGICIDYAYSGQIEKAREMMEHFEWEEGARNINIYYKARVHAVLNEQEEAMKLCQEHADNWSYSHLGSFLFKHDYFMKNMNGYPPYEELTRVRD